MSDSALCVRIIANLLILIETDHLIEYLLGHLIDRCELEGRDGDLNIA